MMKDERSRAAAEAAETAPTPAEQAKADVAAEKAAESTTTQTA